jgi:molybdate transport system substrate-binding protein
VCALAALAADPYRYALSDIAIAGAPMSLTRRLAAWCVLATLTLPLQAAEAPPGDVLVLAASSLTDVLNDIAARYTRETGAHVKLSFAASSALARQIEAGAPADVFFSADTDWMDYLQSHDLIQPPSRHDIVGNRLVLIAPAASPILLTIGPGFALASALGSGRLATGDPDSVPVGRSAKAALMNLGVWTQVQDRIVRAENVRAALELVARAEAPLGIVYRTDARIEKSVRIVAEFPASSHPPIIYPAALTRAARPAARRFLDYLQSPAAHEAFERFGFAPLPHI